MRLAGFLKSQRFSSTTPGLVTFLEKSGQPFTRFQPLGLGWSNTYLDLIRRVCIRILRTLAKLPNKPGKKYLENKEGACAL